MSDVGSVGKRAKRLEKLRDNRVRHFYASFRLQESPCRIDVENGFFGEFKKFQARP